MRKRLYLQIYLTIVGSLVLVVLVAAVLWHASRHESPARRAFDMAGELAGAALPAGTAPVAEQQRAVVQLGARLGTDLALFDAAGARIAEAGDAPPPPTDARRGWMRTPRGPAWVLDLPDGRRLVAVMPPPGRDPGLALLLFLCSIALAVALAALPVTRRITRRLERLQASVEQLGAGDLEARVEVQGRDEVARLAASFNRAAERIGRLVSAHKMLLAHASHELRTPLTRIRLGIELLGEADPARTAELKRDVAELDELVASILLASRLDALDDLTTDEDVDLLALAAEECARYDEVELSGEPVTVPGDARLLRHLLRNLLDNAARYGMPPISVEVRRVGDEARMVVGDAGSPIPEPERARLFQPFHRGGGAHGGTGLGLSLVRLIAERHRGRVVYRAEGGNRFEVTLPLRGPVG